MNLLNNEQYKRFFFSGIDNKEDVKEGIIYFASKQVYSGHKNDDWYSLPNEMLLEEILGNAVPKYRQFYRFVTLNDQYKKYNFDVDLDQIRKELEEKVESLLESGDMIKTKAGIFITRGEAQRLDSKPYYQYGEGMQGEETWTRQLYRILEKLETLEKSNILEYYECWIFTKLQRAILRNEPDEIPYMERAYQLFEKRKQKIKEERSKEESGR